MIYLLLFIGGFCVAVYVAFQCLPHIISALDKINVVEVRAARAEGQNEVYQVMMTGLMQQNTGIVYAALDTIKEANRQISPSPTQVALPNDAYMYARTHARTQEQDENQVVEIIYRGTDKYKGLDFGRGIDYLCCHHNNIKYFADFPQGTERVSFLDADDNELTGLFAQNCENEGCVNIVISDSYQTKTCSPKCKNQKNHG